MFAIKSAKLKRDSCFRGSVWTHRFEFQQDVVVVVCAVKRGAEDVKS